jgi:hypothetical protein
MADVALLLQVIFLILSIVWSVCRSCTSVARRGDTKPARRILPGSRTIVIGAGQSERAAVWRMGGTTTALYGRIVRGVGRLHTPALLRLVTPQVRLLRQSLGLTGPGLPPRKCGR